MAKKVQLPVVGGVRKVIVPGGITTAGTTIAEIGDNTITLAQLKTLLGLLDENNSGTIGSSSTASILPGAQISGGGPLIGVVPLGLGAPIPAFIFDEGGSGDGDPGPPGLPGKPGAPGVSNIPGPPTFIVAEDGQDGQDAIPGPQGIRGATGAGGAAGSQGPAVFMLSNDGEDGDTIPGPQGPAGSGGGGSTSPFNVTPDTHLALPTGVGVGPNDEFEFGASIDLTGSRYAGATAWSWVNQSGFTALQNNGQMILSSNASTIASIVQVVPIGAWRFRMKMSVPAPVNFGGMQLYNSITNNSLIFGPSSATQISMFQFTGAFPTGFPFTGSPPGGNTLLPLYYEIEYDGTTQFTFRCSLYGVDGPTFITEYTQSLSTFLTAITHIGIALLGNAGANTNNQVVDWFRQEA